MRAAIYCRVSTEDQEREGTSLQTQQEACLKYCQEKDYNVSYRFSEAYSGLTLDRPRLSELRELVRAGDIDVIVVYCLDRLSRDPTHGVILTQEVEKYNVTLEAVTEDIDNSELGKLINYIRGFAAKLEAEKIRERTMRGKMERVKAGRLPGGRFTKLYGYNYVSGRGTGEGIRYVNEIESKVVKEIYRLYIEEGLSLCKITRKLNSLDISSPSGKGTWNRTGVYNILTNPAYTGKTFLFTRYKAEADHHLKASRKNKLTHVVMRPREEWVELKGATPALVSEDLFAQVQLKLKRNKELASRNARREYLLSGYVFCSCGRRYTARKKTKHSYYSCPKCKDRSLNAAYIETAIWDKVEEVISNPEVVLAGIEMMRKEANNGEIYHKELDGIEAKLRHMAREKDRVWKAFEITGDEAKFTREIKAIMSGIDELEKRKVELVNKIELAGQTEANIQSIREYCELVRHNLGELSFPEKRQALEALKVRVTSSNEGIKLEGTIPIVSSLSA